MKVSLNMFEEINNFINNNVFYSINNNIMFQKI